MANNLWNEIASAPGKIINSIENAFGTEPQPTSNHSFDPNTTDPIPGITKNYDSNAPLPLPNYHFNLKPIVNPDIIYEDPKPSVLHSLGITSHGVDVVAPQQGTDIDSLIEKYFGDQAPMAKAIMMAESKGMADTIGDTNLMFENAGEKIGDSIGLFQIRTGGSEGGKIWNRAKANGMSADDFRKKMLDPEQNIKYAKSIYDRYGWNHWSTYLNGEYQKYLNQ